MTYWILAVEVGIAVFAAWITWEIIHTPLIKDFPLLGFDLDNAKDDENVNTGKKDDEVNEKKIV